MMDAYEMDGIPWPIIHNGTGTKVADWHATRAQFEQDKTAIARALDYAPWDFYLGWGRDLNDA